MGAFLALIKDKGGRGGAEAGPGRGSTGVAADPGVRGELQNSETAPPPLSLAAQLESELAIEYERWRYKREKKRRRREEKAAERRMKKAATKVKASKAERRSSVAKTKKSAKD